MWGFLKNKCFKKKTSFSFPAYKQKIIILINALAKTGAKRRESNVLSKQPMLSKFQKADFLTLSFCLRLIIINS